MKPSVSFNLTANNWPSLDYRGLENVRSILLSNPNGLKMLADGYLQINADIEPRLLSLLIASLGYSGYKEVMLKDREVNAGFHMQNHPIVSPLLIEKEPDLSYLKEVYDCPAQALIISSSDGVLLWANDAKKCGLAIKKGLSGLALRGWNVAHSIGQENYWYLLSMSANYDEVEMKEFISPTFEVVGPASQLTWVPKSIIKCACKLKRVTFLEEQAILLVLTSASEISK